MNRDDWIYATRNSANDLFMNYDQIQTIFVSTGRGFESILSRSTNAIINIPKIYDTTRDIIFTLNRIFEIFSGSVALFDFEIEGETIRYNSYRIGYQRRINITTDLEYSQSYILRFIAGTIQQFPELLVGAYGETETSFVQWVQSPETKDDELDTNFTFLSILSDANNLIERSTLDMDINSRDVEFFLEDGSRYIVALSDDSKDILLVQAKESLEKWLLRLVNLFKRYGRDRPYIFNEKRDEIDSDSSQSLEQDLSILIMKRFLAYLVPPRKRSKIDLKLVAEKTKLSSDLILKFFNEYVLEKAPEYGIAVEKTSKHTYYFKVKNLSKYRILSDSLMEIHKYYDQFISKLPSKHISASEENFELRNTGSYLGKIWGSYIHGKLIGESDVLFILYNEIINELHGLNESRTLLQNLKIAMRESNENDENNDIFFTQHENLKTYLEQKIAKLNENITKFITLIVQSYLVLLKTIYIPDQILTSKKNQESITTQVELQFTIKNDIDGEQKVITLLDEPKDWIILLFFSYLLSQNKHVEVFLKSCNVELQSFYRSIEHTWDSLQLLTLNSSEDEWKASTKISKLFIKPSRRKIMVNKILDLK